MDIIGHCDPYVIATFGSPHDGQGSVTYKTFTHYATAAPTWDEEIFLRSVPNVTSVKFEVWDSDPLTPDDMVGNAATEINTALVPEGAWHMTHLPIKSARGRAAGTLRVQWCWSTAPEGGWPTMMHVGPVRYRVAHSSMAGRIVRCNGSYDAYEVSLMGIKQFFTQGASVQWNRAYDKAQQIFTNPALATALRTQHSSLYSDKKVKLNRGVFAAPEEFLKLLSYGHREGEHRAFTYVLLEDTWRFSETGAAFLVDLMSKHAMHAGVAEKVVCAGEFSILPNPAARYGCTIYVDNNSGTYAPPAELLPKLRELIMFNFPGLDVQYVSAGSDELKAIHARIPSRLAIR